MKTSKKLIVTLINNKQFNKINLVLPRPKLLN